jgi:hypothetical protein
MEAWMLWLAGAVLLLGILAGIPGAIARQRGHDSAAAISLCGWVGLIFAPAWFIALIWAFTGPDKSKMPTAYPRAKSMNYPS